jgi:hypothetical protein
MSSLGPVLAEGGSSTSRKGTVVLIACEVLTTPPLGTEDQCAESVMGVYPQLPVIDELS